MWQAESTRFVEFDLWKIAVTCKAAATPGCHKGSYSGLRLLMLTHTKPKGVPLGEYLALRQVLKSK